MPGAERARDLLALQTWMQAVVVHRGTLDEAVAHAAARTATRPEDVLRPSARLTPAERVGIYHRMFGLRMIGAIGEDAPVLRAVLGKRAFGALVRDYVDAHPSRSWTLNRASHALAAYLARHPLAAERPWLVDVARVEEAGRRARDAAVAEPLTPEALAAVPPDAWDRARLVTAPSLTLLTLAHDVEPLFAVCEAAAQDARDAQAELPVPAARPGALAVWRAHGRQRLALEPAAHALLAALAARRPLDEALAAAFPGEGASSDDVACVQAWMTRWVAAGMFTAVEAGA